nr:biotin/lipoyl-containing protein [Cetobacterium sp. 2A]
MTEINYEEPNFKITIKKPLEVASQKSVEKIMPKIEKEVKVNTKEILSNSIGRFFYKTSSGDDIISVGDQIKVGQDIGYITTIGVKNHVKATVSGEIEEICLENGGIADYGKVLLKVKSN